MEEMEDELMEEDEGSDSPLPQDSLSGWICRETGVMVSQYNEKANEHLIQCITHALKKYVQHSSIAPCNDSLRSLPSSVVMEISELCLPILHLKKALPIVECLLECKFQSADLSPSFLKNLTARLQSHGDSGSTATLSNKAKVALWSCYLPSFRQELLHLVESVETWSSDQDEPLCEEDILRNVLWSSYLPQACLERAHLLLYTNEFLQ